jgi:alpha-glucuronidase
MTLSRPSAILLGLVSLLGGAHVKAEMKVEDGYELWLRYAPRTQKTSTARIASLVMQGESKTEQIALAELQRGLAGLQGADVPRSHAVGNGSLLVGTPNSSPLVAALGWGHELARLGPEGFAIRSLTLHGRRATVIASQSAVGCLYGSFHLLRLLATGQAVPKRGIAEKPRIRRRLLNHWDNLDGTIERGYAGQSLWRWDELPQKMDARIADYGRANASLGLNGAVLNNVNASPEILTGAYLAKVAALADVLRPYGIRVYLSANFAAPKALGDLATADPLDPAVAAWWKKKAQEIYDLIPDFGGYLVKANSEGQPGPFDYGRSHADGANMLADSLAPLGGVVIWRAFVYQAGVDYDRIKRAYLEIMPHDGEFRSNVFVQAKNGPLDFQVREPFHPLFGGLAKTKVAVELQITQEYFGHSTHLVYLGQLWHEFLTAETYAKGTGSKATGSTVAAAVDGTLFSHTDSLIAGVANTGSDRNWCGHPFAAANWYAFGRLAWNPLLDPDDLAREWVLQTWGSDPRVVETSLDLMKRSWPAFIDYDSPLGLAGVYEKDLHYAPDPGMVDARHEDWSASYFNRADAAGLGFDRTRKGSGAVDQYHAPLPDLFDDIDRCPEKFLLWFHHVPWDHRLKSGRTLWYELCLRYERGVREAAAMKAQWEGLKSRVDPERYRVVLEKLSQQAEDAKAWREKSLGYFRQFSGRPIPAASGAERP